MQIQLIDLNQFVNLLNDTSEPSSTTHISNLEIHKLNNGNLIIRSINSNESILISHDKPIKSPLVHLALQYSHFQQNA